MALSNKLGRNLRAEESSDDSENYEVTDRSSSESVLETGAGGEIVSSDNDDVDESENEDDEDMSDASDDDGHVQAQMSKVSFGALAKAHDALSKDKAGDRKRKRGEEPSQGQEDKLEALRARLRQIKADKMASGAIDPSASKSKKSKSAKPAEKKQKRSEEPDSDSDSDAAPHARSSKHAPAVQSSKRMVSRKRNVVDVKKPTFRDPRFDAGGQRPDEHTVGKRYAFLNDYKASEIADLKRAIKKTKSEGEREQLKKQLISMESQQKARENKEHQAAVIRDHKKKEKELVKDGKQPFFLKKSEQKKLALIDKFQNMKSKQRDKTIERRRKKLTSKERRNMPADRRTA